MSSERWYRYEDRTYAPPLDEFDNVCGPSRTEVVLRSFRVLKHTPKGVWISMGIGGKRFVLESARKRFACSTKESAKESFLARKNRHAKILRAQLATVEFVIDLINRGRVRELTYVE